MQMKQLPTSLFEETGAQLKTILLVCLACALSGPSIVFWMHYSLRDVCVGRGGGGKSGA